MNSRFFAVALAVGLCVHARGADTQTDIRTEPGGKRLLFVDGNDIRTAPGGQRLLCVDDHSIRPNPTGKVLLYLDDDNVRDAFGGIRLAYWDGHALRRNPASTKTLIYIDDNDIRTDAGGKRLFYIDGTKLSLGQLTAVLYQLKPELFQLSADENRRLHKEMSDNEAESDAQASADPFVGKYDILGYNSSDHKQQTGTVTVSKQGKYYALALDNGANPAWKGIATTHKLADGTVELWAAVGPAAAVSLGIYEASDGKLNGTWIPVNAADDAGVLGQETLTAPPTGGGVCKIESGKLPNGGASYSGALQVIATDADAGSDAKTFQFKWATGTTGAAFSVGDAYAVSAGWGADYEVIRVHPYLGNLVGGFVGKTNHGTFILSK